MEHQEYAEVFIHVTYQESHRRPECYLGRDKRTAVGQWIYQWCCQCSCSTGHRCMCMGTNSSESLLQQCNNCFILHGNLLQHYTLCPKIRARFNLL